MKKILITGASGFLGSELFSSLKSRYNVIGTYGTHVKPDLKHLDLEQKDEVTFKFLDEVNPDVLFHLAAEANINTCSENKSRSWQINVGSTRVLTEWCKQNDKEIIFTSTDQVFNGKGRMYEEKDELAPLHDYGAQKVASEMIVLSHSKGKVCRMPLMIGENGGYMNAFIENLKKGNAQQLFTDEFRSVLHIKDAAIALEQCMDWSTGLYHLGGPQRMNRFELGKHIVTAIDLDEKLISKSSHTKVDFKIPRPADVSMNSEKARLLGFQPKLLIDRLLQRDGDK